ncbi:MAG TPA: hypothetical protein VJ783_06285 [Pirellulales bacterium]|nr:hypothetical protein [Pirellulales bacterium]
MQRLIVNDQQAEVIREAHRKVEVRDPAGKVVGYVIPAPSADEIAKVEQRLARTSAGHVSQRN